MNSSTRDGGGGALALPVQEGGAEGQVAVAGGGGEEGFALSEGDEQQVALAGFVPEHAFAVDTPFTRVGYPNTLQVAPKA
jgi:hypothetical protein